jgi:hypothetical protein
MSSRTIRMWRWYVKITLIYFSFSFLVLLLQFLVYIWTQMKAIKLKNYAETFMILRHVIQTRRDKYIIVLYAVYLYGIWKDLLHFQGYKLQINACFRPHWWGGLIRVDYAFWLQKVLLAPLIGNKSITSIRACICDWTVYCFLVSRQSCFVRQRFFLNRHPLLNLPSIHPRTHSHKHTHTQHAW